MKKHELIFDFETLSVENLHRATTLELSLFAFERERFVKNPYTFEEIVSNVFYVKYNSSDLMKRHRTSVCKGAVEFWKGADVEAQKRTFLPSENDLTIEDIIAMVSEYIESNRVTYWWSRSNMFDPVILAGQFSLLGMTPKFKELLAYNKVRDTRSFIDGYFGIEANATNFVPVEEKAQEAEFGRKFIKHYSPHDIATDVLRLQLIERNRHGI